MSGEIGIATIVTEAFVDEFAILKYSFELFHGTGCRWFVRCDRASVPALSAYDNVSCVVFAERQADRPETKSALFLRIMAEKMNAMEDAWSALADCEGVILLDADLVFMAPVLETIRAMDGDLILSPNYYPNGREHLVARDGEFNAGFVFTRSRTFHDWWRAAYDADPVKNNEQVCLNQVREHFVIAVLGENANIGFWRTTNLPYKEIPADCSFLHVHLYQPLSTLRHWLDKSFALHCMHFLMISASREHRLLFEHIREKDRHGWFDASLRVCGAVVQA